MLSISPPMRGGGSGDYYLKLAQQDYYTKSLGPPGQWFGKGAEALELRGKVEPEPLKNLFEGKSPDGSKSLVQIQQWQKRERQSAWDMTFSAPKSVSVLWSQGSEVLRAKIESIHRAALEKGLAFLEEEAGITRRGQGGKIWEKAKVVFALFQHGTSRANDPQLHTHAILVNLSIREDGTTGALRSKGFFENKIAAGAVYQLELAKQLREQLKLEMAQDEVGFRVVGVPEHLCDEFSKRRRHIEAVLAQEGDFSAETASKVTMLTRPAKHELPADELFAQWHEVGRTYGWGPEQAQHLVDAAAEAFKRLEPDQRKATTSLADKKAEEEAAEKLLDAIYQLPKREASAKKSGPNSTGQMAEEEAKAHKRSEPNDGKFTAKEADKKAEQQAAKKLLDAIHGRQKNDERKEKPTFKSADAEQKKHPYFHFETRWLVPRAPEWSIISQLRKPVLVLGEAKSKDWWGKVHAEMSTPLGKLQFRDKLLFPHAAEWNPLKNFALPRLVLKQDTQWAWRENLWKKNTSFGQLQFRWKALFPHAAENSLAGKLALPGFRLQTKRPEPTFKLSNEKHHSH